MIKVYKIVNNSDEVEHVGQTQDLIERFRKHTKQKPGLFPNGQGKFYKRTDVRIEVISEWPTRREAKIAEKHWQLHYNVEDGCGYANHKLSKEQVEYIRSSNKTQRQLAKELGVGNPTIWKVRNYKTYQII